MATETPEREFQQAADRVRDINDQLFESGKRAGILYLDLYERTLKSAADLEERVAGSVQVGPFSELAKAHASFTRDFATASTQAARELLT